MNEISCTPWLQLSPVEEVSILWQNCSEMATVTACTPTLSITRTALVQGRVVAAPSSLLGLSVKAKGKVRCSKEGRASVEESSSKAGMGASLVCAACAAATMSSPAVALVDERMSAEGIGLPFGLSNNLLGWILFGVFGLVWSLYFVYTSTLEEDADSGLSL
ncbi:photosystem II reaction center W protein, chloroplastic-like [Actinidia eriantha]|uniref:photosystem II reaction center W protein, chloroplastic-like n=1 Tax=Actinidia eriantha TaxID=165200 RepID=UPI0025871606|nr:photosystem II reaction center W protein, chloroplastic-like [Actinidia eriantha]